MNKFGLKSKIMCGVLVPVILMLVLGIIAAMNINKIVETNEHVEHTYKVLSQASGIVGSAVDMETGMRGYLLAGEDGFLDPYRGGEKATYASIKDLQQTVSDNPTQVARLNKVKTVLEQWQSDVTEPTIQLRRDIGDAETMNDMADLVGEARGKKYFDAFRGQIATFISREKGLLDQRKVEADAVMKSGKADMQQLRKLSSWVEHTYVVIAEANDILAAAVDMETGMRGYLLAGKEEFLNPYNMGGKKFDELLLSLQKTVNDNPAQVQLLSDVRETIHGWKSAVVEPMIALRTKIGDAKNMDDMADLIGEARGKKYFDEFRGLMADFQSMEQVLMEKRQAENVATVTSTMRLIVSAILAAIVIGLAVLALALHNGAIIGFIMGQQTNELKLRIDTTKKSVELFGFEVLPRIYGSFLAFLFYRWEVIMRESAILGILGIHTLGFFIDSAIADIRLDKVVILLFFTALLNILVDYISRRVRKYLRLSKGITNSCKCSI